MLLAPVLPCAHSCDFVSLVARLLFGFFLCFGIAFCLADGVLRVWAVLVVVFELLVVLVCFSTIFCSV